MQTVFFCQKMLWIIIGVPATQTQPLKTIRFCDRNIHIQPCFFCCIVESPSPRFGFPFQKAAWNKMKSVCMRCNSVIVACRRRRRWALASPMVTLVQKPMKNPTLRTWCTIQPTKFCSEAKPNPKPNSKSTLSKSQKRRHEMRLPRGYVDFRWFFRPLV